MPTNSDLDSSLDGLAPFLPLLTAGGYTGPTTVNAVLNLTVGQFRTLLGEIPDLVRTIPGAVWQNALNSTPAGPGRIAIQQFAAGNFSLIDDAIDTALQALSGYPASTRLRDALEGLGVPLPFDYDIPAFADFDAPDPLRGGGFRWETPAFSIDANGNWSYLGYSGAGVNGFDARGSGGLAGLWEGAANLIGAMYFEAIEASLRAAGVRNPGGVATNATNGAALMEYQDAVSDAMQALLSGTVALRAFARTGERDLTTAARGVEFDGDAFFDGILRAIGYSVSQSDVVFGVHSGDGVRAFGNHRDTYVGGAGRDLVRLGGRDDKGFGMAGNDLIKGERGNDQLFGGSGKDRLEGGLGRDMLDGGAGNDVLKGNAGNDRLFGQGGNDRLDGGAGNDALSGGRGADDFVFNGGADRIADFRSAQNDEIWLDRDALGLGTLTAAQVVNRHAEVSGNSVVFDFGDGNTLTLARVNSLNGLADDIVLF